MINIEHTFLTSHLGRLNLNFNLMKLHFTNISNICKKMQKSTTENKSK